MWLPVCDSMHLGRSSRRDTNLSDWQQRHHSREIGNLAQKSLCYCCRRCFLLKRAIFQCKRKVNHASGSHKICYCIQLSQSHASSTTVRPVLLPCQSMVASRTRFSASPAMQVSQQYPASHGKRCYATRSRSVCMALPGRVDAHTFFYFITAEKGRSSEG